MLSILGKWNGAGWQQRDKCSSNKNDGHSMAKKADECKIPACVRSISRKDIESAVPVANGFTSPVGNGQVQRLIFPLS